MQCRRSGPLSVPQPQQLPAPAQVAATPLLESQGVKHRVLAANTARHGVLAAHIGVLAGHVAGHVWVIAGNIGVLAGKVAGSAAGHISNIRPGYPVAGGEWQRAGTAAGLLRVKRDPLSLFVTHGDTVTEDNVLRWPELGEN